MISFRQRRPETFEKRLLVWTAGNKSESTQQNARHIHKVIPRSNLRDPQLSPVYSPLSLQLATGLKLRMKEGKKVGKDSLSSPTLLSLPFCVVNLFPTDIRVQISGVVRTQESTKARGVPPRVGKFSFLFHIWLQYMELYKQDI